MRRQGFGTIVNYVFSDGPKGIRPLRFLRDRDAWGAAFSDALRQELAGTNINVSVIYPALTATALLQEVNEAERGCWTICDILRKMPVARAIAPHGLERVKEPFSLDFHNAKFG